MRYRRLIAHGIEAVRVASLVGPAPRPSGTPAGEAVAAVIQARARLERPARDRASALGEQRSAASA